jgi:hypothetical protein
MSVFFPAGTFYDFDMNFDVKDDTLSSSRDSSVHSILQLQSDNKYTDSQKEKSFIADISKVDR